MTPSTPAPTADRASPPPAVEVRVGAEGFRTEIEVRGHSVVADEPLDAGGTDEGPTPYEYLLAALGSCTAMTLRMYASRKGWPLEAVVVRLWHGRSYAEDCERSGTEEVGVHRVERELKLVGELDDAQRARLHQIADRCPVKQTLGACIRVDPVG